MIKFSLCTVVGYFFIFRMSIAGIPLVPLPRVGENPGRNPVHRSSHAPRTNRGSSHLSSQGRRKHKERVTTRMAMVAAEDSGLTPSIVIRAIVGKTPEELLELMRNLLGTSTRLEKAVKKEKKEGGAGSRFLESLLEKLSTIATTIALVQRVFRFVSG